jgi:NADH-quinone oxidoreductase subunit M
MLKMGLYSLLRWVLPISPMAVAAYTDVVLILCVVGIIYASWIAISQKDIKRLFAWSSIAHVGLITAGIFTLSRTGFQGALIQMIAHGVNVVGLFFVAEIFLQRRNTTMMEAFGGIRSKAPVFASVFMIISFASIALPLTNGFIGEFLLLSSLYEYSYIFAALAGLAVILGAVYTLRAYKNTMLGEESSEAFADLSMSEKFVFFPIVALILFFGIYPQFIFNLTDESVKYLLNEIAHHMASNY